MSSSLFVAADFTKALVEQIKVHPGVIEAGIKNIERGDYVNQHPEFAPWVGVYRTRITHTPRRLGQHAKTWNAMVTAKLVIQAHGADGADAEDRLEDAIQAVMTAVLSDLTVGGSVSMLKAVDTEYSYDETDSKSMDFQWAFITLTYETETGV